MAEPFLKVRHLVKDFAGRRVLDDISFDLSRGEILGMMGGSGSGKSTILKIIIGLIKADQGEVWFENSDLCLKSESQLAELRVRIGYVFQNGALFDSLTVEENMAYPLEKHTRMSDQEILKRVNERLKHVGMEGTNHLYPSELSGGMNKRAGLVRATILDPKLILFDEPTSGLDPINTQNFIRQIRQIRSAGEVAGVFVSHDPLSVLAICERVGVLWNGSMRIVETRAIQDSQDPAIRAFFRADYQGNDEIRRSR
ncbi:MAG: hypothetical protein A2428_15800 [Bdellovibrionales bacterium RIFOXYC1_FULL_54_43]|nr:MAG: hypothetical protein A2428_15800 [Bdellovibrionales bacterium RIFOXYC1_FULL_54_43]OFZ85384.1 MAG: hypothetical protein A2603_00720 [Bdellovibrionales bacterium RIFOXYD1_FULL_55_31]